MRRRWLMGAFAAVCAAQLAVPALMIRTYEVALARGRPFKVRCQPVDPSDAFRGRYVRIGLDLPAPEGMQGDLFPWGARLWAVIEEGPDGFARATSIHEERPATGEAVPVRYAGSTFDPESDAPGPPRFRLEIDRYYMPEARAPEAERAYRRHAGASDLESHAVVRVLDGVAVIEGLYIGGRPIEEFTALPPEQAEEAGAGAPGS